MHAHSCTILVLIGVVALFHRSSGQPKEVITAIVSGDSVTFIDEKMVENCAARFAVDVKVEGSTVKVTQRDTISAKANCICEFSVTAVVRGLAPGQYTAVVTREYLQRYGYGSDETREVGSINFVVSDGIARPVGFNKRQSECLNTAASTLPEIPSFVTIVPNPIIGSSMLTFDVQTASTVSIELFTILGTRISRQELGFTGPGTYRWPISAEAFPNAGQYFCIVAAGIRRAFVNVTIIR
jgi:hypothetical protein